jgi:predicted nicotinamide N-methyase
VLDDVAAAADLRERLSGQRESDPQHLPYWAELWDSAIGMATYLAARTNLGPNVSILDLGCGMGLSGVVAAAKGCRVTFADMEAEALLFAQLNAMTVASDPDMVRARCLNWQRDNLGERFDLILGADILYERKQWEYLEPFWRAHLAPNGRVLLGEPGRPTGDAFPEWIQPRGWSFTSREQVTFSRPKPIRLFSLQMQES